MNELFSILLIGHWERFLYYSLVIFNVFITVRSQETYVHLYELTIIPKFKQGAQKPKGALEVLRPKLEVTPHHQVRSRLSADDASTTKCEGSRDTTHHTSSETEECMSDVGKDEVIASGDHTSVG
uniref:Uncharacterized protein LOC107428935 n=1 Tax=Rhizophora mucronata TaxID=61149 RepID=A0A2P2KMR5_RHIMU